MKEWNTVPVTDRLKNGLKYEADKQSRSVASLVTMILKKHGIKEMSDQELSRRLKNLEVTA